MAHFNLSGFPVKRETAKWINLLFDEETQDRNGNYMLRGFTRIEMSEVSLLKLSFGDYSRSSLNFWAYNDEELLLYTFCEGDTTLTIFTDPEIYKVNKSAMLRWYKEEQ